MAQARSLRWATRTRVPGHACGDAMKVAQDAGLVGWGQGLLVYLPNSTDWPLAIRYALTLGGACCAPEVAEAAHALADQCAADMVAGTPLARGTGRATIPRPSSAGVVVADPIDWPKLFGLGRKIWEKSGRRKVWGTCVRSPLLLLLPGLQVHSDLPLVCRNKRQPWSCEAVEQLLMDTSQVNANGVNMGWAKMLEGNREIYTVRSASWCEDLQRLWGGFEPAVLRGVLCGCSQGSNGRVYSGGDLKDKWVSICKAACVGERAHKWPSHGFKITENFVITSPLRLKIEEVYMLLKGAG